MAFLKLYSENLNLSWIIEKRPNTGMNLKELRSGFLFGFFPEKDGKTIENEYCIYFKDSSDEISYKEHPDQSFEYLSSSKYTNARFITDAIEELLRSAREGVHTYQKEGIEYDVPSIHKMVINLVATQYKTIDIFQRYFKDIKIESEEVIKNNFKLTFTALQPVTLSYFLNLINLFGIFAILNSNDYTYVHEGMVVKYLKLINKIDAPYFIRYLYKVRLLRSEKKFALAKKDLEVTNLYNNVAFTYGDSHDARIEWVKQNLSLENNIVDIGTGIDYRYLKIFAPLLEAKNLTYYAIEKDPEAREKITFACKNRGYENVEIFETLDEFLELYDHKTVNVLCTEVLEHNEVGEVSQILKTVMDKISFNSFLITVPNAEFNQFYGLEGMKRHDDHKWEYTFEEFKGFITSLKVCNKYNISTSWFGIGDIVNSIPVTSGLIIKEVDKNLTELTDKLLSNALK